MTSLVTERLARPATSREVRATSAAQARAADVLAGRTVWSTVALNSPSPAADRLCGRMHGAGPGVAANHLELGGDEPRRHVADRVGPDDVVVAHDAVSAGAALAARECGAHAVWHVLLSAARWSGTREMLDVLSEVTSSVDAYLLTWVDLGPRGQVVEHVAAAMPSTGVVAAKELGVPPADEWSRRLVWRIALAEIVRSDRDECVGGRLHPRPTVAAR